MRTCVRIFCVAFALLSWGCGTGDRRPTPSANGQLMAANEIAAISQLRAIGTAETQYVTTTGGGSYGTLKQLVDAQVIDARIAAGENRGYRFEVRVTPSGYDALATPAQYGITGQKSFLLQSNGSEIHGADKRGAEASASDPAV